MHRTILILFTFITATAQAQHINISIFNDFNVKSVVITPVEGKYDIIASPPPDKPIPRPLPKGKGSNKGRGENDSVFKLETNSIIYLTLIGDSISIRDLDKSFGVFKKIEIRGTEKINNFIIKPVSPALEQRVYNDNLIILVRRGGSVANSRLIIISEVDLENYIARVVETEGGPKSPTEYYKSQAIICRTYALEKFSRHIEEGFNLCDGVHCQAYKGKSIYSKIILEATKSTSGLIIVDTNLTLITAAFHSNCGGETVNSEDVWVMPKSYLKSVKDNFCIEQPNSKWKKTISIAQWKKYLTSYGIKIPSIRGGGLDIVSGGVCNSNPDKTQIDELLFEQQNRKVYYTINNASIPLKRIRDDWKLRSTFFSIKSEGNNLLLKGKGYGHGVGLCQEGAMQMAKMGYNYKEIIKFYYKNVHIISLEALEFFNENY